MSRTLLANCGSRESSKVRSRCGARPWARQIFCTVLIARPMSLAIARLVAERALDQLRDDRPRDRRLAGLARLVAQQARDARLHEAPLPAPDTGFRHAGSPHDLRRAAAFGRGKDDPCPPDMLLDAV